MAAVSPLLEGLMSYEDILFSLMRQSRCIVCLTRGVRAPACIRLKTVGTNHPLLTGNEQSPDSSISLKMNKGPRDIRRHIPAGDRKYRANRRQRYFAVICSLGNNLPATEGPLASGFASAQSVR